MSQAPKRRCPGLVLGGKELRRRGGSLWQEDTPVRRAAAGGAQVRRQRCPAGEEGRGGQAALGGRIRGLDTPSFLLHHSEGQAGLVPGKGHGSRGPGAALGTVERSELACVGGRDGLRGVGGWLSGGQRRGEEGLLQLILDSVMGNSGSAWR